MSLKNKTVCKYLSILTAVILISVILRCTALFIDFVPETGYFNGKALITAASIITAAGAVLLLTYAFTAQKGERLIASFSTPETYIPTGAVCTSLSVFIIHGIIKLKSLKLPAAELLSLKDLGRTVFVLSTVLAIGAVFHFALTALITERSSSARAAFGLSNVLFLALYASYLYFDTTLSLNAPNKIVDQMAFLFTALFFLYEVRISLKREVWNFYISFGFIAALLTAYSSIPSIIYYFAKGTAVSNSIYENILCLCLFIFIFSRLILASKLKEDKESEFIEYIKAYSTERVSEAGKTSDEALEAYLEIFKNEEPTNEMVNDKISDEELRDENSDEDLIEITSAEEALNENAPIADEKAEAIDEEASASTEYTEVTKSENENEDTTDDGE